MNINTEIVENLDEVELKHLFDLYSRVSGYTECPPTISEFISNEYYLGASLKSGESIFPFWKEQLIDIFPTPFYESNKYKVILLSGATGIGKCAAFEQEMDFQMSEADIEKYGLEEYLV